MPLYVRYLGEQEPLDRSITGGQSDSYVETPATKKSKSSSPRSHPKPQKISLNPSNGPHRTSSIERSQHLSRSSQHPLPPPCLSSRILPPLSVTSRTLLSSPPTGLSPPQLGYQRGPAIPAPTIQTYHRDREIPGRDYTMAPRLHPITRKPNNPLPHTPFLTIPRLAYSDPTSVRRVMSLLRRRLTKL